MFHGAHDAGKGDVPRPVNRRKWDAGYLRAFGKPCPFCKEKGTICSNAYDVLYHKAEPIWEQCDHCVGIGFVKKRR